MRGRKHAGFRVTWCKYDDVEVIMKARTLNIAMGVALAASACMAGPKTPSSVTLRVSGSLHAALVGVIQKNVKRPETPGSYLGLGGNLTGVLDGKKDGLGFGAVAAIDLDKVKTAEKRVNEAYVFVNGPLGGIYAGAMEGPVTTLMHDATDVIGGAKGPLGWITRTTEQPIGVNVYSGLRLGATNKIAVTSASMKGLIVGLSFSPDSEEPGRFERGITKNGAGWERKLSFRNVIEAALNFTKTLDGNTFGFFLGGVFGQVVPAQKGLKKPDDAPSYTPLSAFQAGALFDVGNLRFAAGYFNWGKSAVRKGTPFSAPQGFNFGAGVTVGKLLFSASYFRTWRDVEGGKATNDLVPITVDYLLAPGCTIYGGVDFVISKSTKEHTSEAGKRDFNLDKVWDGGGFTTENGGPETSNAQVFSLGMKLQC